MAAFATPDRADALPAYAQQTKLGCGRCHVSAAGGGALTGFGKAFVVGALIAVVASVCYVATWEVIYFNFAPDFAQKYQAHMIEKARAAGGSEAAIAAKKAEYEKFARLYRNPAINAAITFLEPLPVGLVVALVSAGVVSRRKKELASGGLLHRAT